MDLRTRHVPIAAALLVLGLSAQASAQTAPAPAGPAVNTSMPMARWLDFQGVSVGARHRVLADTDGDVTANHLVANQSVKVQFKVDAQGRLGLHAGVFTGNAFTGSWNNTGIGTGAPAYQLYLKQLFASVKPMRGLEIQAGSLYVNRGQSTEATTYDNDGYVVGERVSLKRRELTTLDELTVTSGYLGDISTPSALSRRERMFDHNYLQFLVAKKLGSRLAVSADYTHLADLATWRQAARIDRLGPVDAVRLELYQRVQAGRSAGVAVTIDKQVPHALLQAGFADIDRHYGGLNADRFKDGRRLFVAATAPVPRAPEFAASVFLGQAVGNERHLGNGTRLDVTLVYDVLSAFTRHRR